jgi:phosphomannomutase
MTLDTVTTGLKFGTSGVRGLVTDFERRAVCAYVIAFLKYLEASQQLVSKRLVIGWDLRPSSPNIAAHVIGAAEYLGFSVDLAAEVPTPALALRCLALRAAGIMVTGSHIPFDRNGLKFYTHKGEILKRDEQGILSFPLAQEDVQSCAGADRAGALFKIQRAKDTNSTAAQDYAMRYRDAVPQDALAGVLVGVYQHSAVGRDLLSSILSALGADVVQLGRSTDFVPIDTEAVSEADEQMAKSWCQKHRLHAVVSTDGDGDRPWVCDERGTFVRGDILGLVTAHWLGVKHIATPVSSNSSVELAGLFDVCRRTRIGSPYVIAAMQDLQQEGCDAIAGFEANGGFLLQTQAGGFSALPTRDSVLPILAVLVAAKQKASTVSKLVSRYQLRFTESDRLQGIGTEKSKTFIQRLAKDADLLKTFLNFTGSCPSQTDLTDGLRVHLANGEVVHLRPSGNAPELRCYVESVSSAAAKSLLTRTMQHLQLSGDLA